MIMGLDVWNNWYPMIEDCYAKQCFLVVSKNTLSIVSQMVSSISLICLQVTWKRLHREISSRDGITPVQLRNLMECIKGVQQ